MQKLKDKVIKWAEDKGIFTQSDPTSQLQQELNTTLEYNSAQMCKKCVYKDANDNLKALYCNSCFRNYVDNFEELKK